MKHFFGIDFGTTNSCIAWVDNFGQPTTIYNIENNNTTPSVVFFDTNQVIVGEYAKSSFPAFPEKIIVNPKRKIGINDFLYIVNDKEWDTLQIVAIILKKLAKDVFERTEQKVTDAVIACPINFTIEQRELLKLAGNIADIKIHAVITEPLAAAIAYGYTNKITNKNVLVFDLGGGTLDLSLIKIFNNKTDVVLNSGDYFLGGNDWDIALAKYIAHKYKILTGDETDLMLIPEMRIELTFLAEEAKKLLSRHEKTNVRLWYKSHRLNIEITRADFEKATVKLFEKLENQFVNFIKNAKKLGVEKIDQVLLVGGSTFMPKVKEIVNKYLNAEIKLFKPDEAVALGASLLANQFALENELKSKVSMITGIDKNIVDFNNTDPNLIKRLKDKITQELPYKISFDNYPIQIVRNKIDYSLGLVADSNGEKIIYNFIVRNESLPIAKKLIFGTQVYNQQIIELDFYENSELKKIASLHDADYIGNLVLDEIPENIAENTPIEITIEVDALANLLVKAQIKQMNYPIYAEFIFTELPTEKWILDKKDEVNKLNIQ